MLRANLDKYNVATAIHATHAIPDGLNIDRIARIAIVQVATPIKADLLASDAIISNWWLLHFADLDLVEIAIWPPATYAEVMELNPKAIEAEPILSPINDSADAEEQAND